MQEGQSSPMHLFILSDSSDDTDSLESKLQLLIVLEKQITPNRKKALPPAVTIADAAEMVLTTNRHSQPCLVFS
ncbi:hypothetical protein LSH36_2530g00000 [Paralvinella palmiformis]|uniref:Uncharacterized protein n=1 Tax=Paralvinella palmiformis TaxID=53620 RepID=A0AAD9MKF3_9ANNE|nr:hypothetical protein LSH36_2530g00000 [Paralvinella palmiformis]